jgi:hypothetical protein
LFFNWRFLITSLVSSSFSLSFCPLSFVIVLSVVLLFTASDYPKGQREAGRNKRGNQKQ